MYSDIFTFPLHHSLICLFFTLFLFFFFFFFNDTATTEIYTLSLHDALPISQFAGDALNARAGEYIFDISVGYDLADRKSTRLNSSHTVISYAVFCLKKKKKKKIQKNNNKQNHKH